MRAALFYGWEQYWIRLKYEIDDGVPIFFMAIGKPVTWAGIAKYV
jgi:hypothetical protein